MKYILTFFSIYLALNSADAQTSFGKMNAVWHYEFVPDMDIPGMSFLKYQAEKDTLFLGKNCVKINGSFTERTPSKYNTYTLEAKYFYTNADTVFYYNTVYNEFFPLYIFNVSAGDSFVSHIPAPATGIVDTTFTTYIDSVVMINIDGQNLRKVYTSKPKFPTPDTYFMPDYVEKIGSLKGGIIGIDLYTKITFGGDGGLRCYKDDSMELITHLFGATSCDYILPLGIETVINNNNYRVFPNPFINQINIGKVPLKTNANVAIYNLLGQKVLEQNFDANSYCILDTKQLNKGLYLCKMTNEDKQLLLSVKILKQ